jgi:hypothetical protein
MRPATSNNTAPSRSAEEQAAHQQSKAHVRVTYVEAKLSAAEEAMQKHLEEFNEVWDVASEAEAAACALHVTAAYAQRHAYFQTKAQLADAQSSVDQLRGEIDLAAARAEERLEAMILTRDECEANATETMSAADTEQETQYRAFQRKLSERLRVEMDGDKEEKVLQASIDALRSALVTAQTARARAATGDTGVADRVAQER